jgi:hypothetical protein
LDEAGVKCGEDRTIIAKLTLFAPDYGKQMCPFLIGWYIRALLATASPDQPWRNLYTHHDHPHLTLPKTVPHTFRGGILNMDCEYILL